MTQTPPGQPIPEPGRLASGDDPEDLNERIRTLVRTNRRRREITQAQLGDLTKTSRFVINRIETGTTELAADLAAVLAQILDIPDLIELVARRDDPIPVGNARDTVIRRMLNTPGLQRVRAVLADDFNLYRYLHHRVEDDAELKCHDVEVIVPTVGRGRALFGERSVMYGRIEYQIKRLLDLKKSRFYARNSLRLYESDDVIASMLLVTAPGVVEAAVWPPLPVLHKPHEIRAGILPVGSTVEPTAVAQLDGHVSGLIGNRETVKINEAMCLVDPERDESAPPVFTHYFTVGDDREEDVDAGEGTAAALIMVIALCPRGRYGVARRVILYSREDTRDYRRPSLFSNSVEEIDVQRARDAEANRSHDERRSTRASLAAALETTDFLAEHNGVIPDSAFQYAAAREMAMFDLDIDPDRFTAVPLPTELKLIKKPTAAIAPRLFVLELRTDGPEPELAKLQSLADVDEVGRTDLLEGDNLNDFLDDAKQHGFLGDLLTRYEIASR
ncbi:MAG TPA: hypothetical protein VHV74_13610 [Pseudonocardiaceae bacterium]|jgi:transcriptional regulator with XRE-family HTH domain|nr:hypothetical protein [Pseudonocardiaceae bacterium]